ncbi:MAG TPA: ribonuclease HI family protein [Candidatus Limnocylindrales bacterium]|nr:ribonuclease HI family protein [Candidatus Limnocylindrales bacterium]
MTARLLIRTDGAARDNPGPASAGAVLIDASRPDASHPDAPPLSVVSRPLGIQTNNVAEYTALLLALEEAHRLGASEIDLRLDSKLIVEQLHGRWRVKDAKLKPLHGQARQLLAGFQRWDARHEPRTTNRAADALANLALDDPAAAARLEASYRARD